MPNPADYITHIDGTTIAGNVAWGRFRPMSNADKDKPLLKGSAYIYQCYDKKGVHVTGSFNLGNSTTPNWAHWSSMTIRHVWTRDVKIVTAGQHVDHLFVDGWDPSLIGPTRDCLVEDFIMEDSNEGVMTLFFTNGSFRTITIRSCVLGSVVNAPMIDMRVGVTDTVLVDKCPNFRLDLQGRRNSINKIILRDSPGATVKTNKVYFADTAQEEWPTPAITEEYTGPAEILGHIGGWKRPAGNVYAMQGPPTPQNDHSDGIHIGDMAVDVTAEPREVYRCVDNTPGAAVWRKYSLN